MQLDYREFALLMDVELHPNQNRHLLMKTWFSKGRQLFGALVSMLLHEEDMAMSNTLDFAPLFRSTIGFDRILDTLESASRVRSIDTWPPYDIVRKSEDDYRITMAVAGFAEGDLESGDLDEAFDTAEDDSTAHRPRAASEAAALSAGALVAPAGPHAAMMLGDLGARVVKVEAPNGGDDSRGWGPPFLGEGEDRFDPRQTLAPSHGAQRFTRRSRSAAMFARNSSRGR